jgi:glycosyltransferase involved in cell wall biosynthesis
MEVAYLAAPDDHRAALEALGIHVWHIGASGWHDFAAVMRLRRLISRRGYDIVNSHLVRADLYAALATAFQRKVTLVSTRHAYDPRFSSRSGRFVHLLTAVRPHLLIAVSKHMEHMTRVLGIPPWAHITVCYLGIRLDQYVRSATDTRRELGIPSDASVIGTVGRMYPQKGQSALIRAMELVRHEMPGAMLILVGDGPLLGDLEREATALELDDSVRFLGVRSDARDIMSMLDVFVFPSLWETFGLALVEAMALGTACVATDIPPHREIVGTSDAATLVQVADPIALAEAVLPLLKDSQLRVGMGARGRARVAEQFTADTMARTTERIYTQLAVRDPPRPGPITS